jgi:hypothetical protein
MNSIKIMIFLWHLGVVDSLTLFQFCINCGAQYGGLVGAEAAGSMNDIGPSVLLAPLAGLGTSYKYLQAAQGAMEKRARIATLASFMAMSGRATLTDPATNGAAGGTIPTFIGHIKSIIAKSNNSTGGLVFVNPARLSKFTKDEIIVLNLVIVGGVLLIIISSYLLQRIAKASWNYSKKLSQYTIIFGEKRIQNFRQIKKYRKIRSIFKLGSKIFVPLKYVGFLERRLIRVGSSILVRSS